MSGIIGQAADFYRLRLTRLEELVELDFEWRDDILYRQPPRPDVHEEEVWIVEAVELDDEDVVLEVGRFASREEAEELMGRASEDLSEMTRSRFEARYMDSSAGSGGSDST